MLTLYPYLLNATVWVFDDERTGLQEEAFVLGMSEMISKLVAHKQIPNAAQGFTLSFSNQPFEGYDVELKWQRSDVSQIVPDQDGNASPLAGNWYKGIVVGQEMEGWLCPALGLYFTTAPERLFVHASALPPGVNPYWEPTSSDIPRRFVSASTTAVGTLRESEGNKQVWDGSEWVDFRESLLRGDIDPGDCGGKQLEHSSHPCAIGSPHEFVVDYTLWQIDDFFLFYDEASGSRDIYDTHEKALEAYAEATFVEPTDEEEEESREEVE